MFFCGKASRGWFSLFEFVPDSFIRWLRQDKVICSIGCWPFLGRRPGAAAWWRCSSHPQSGLERLMQEAQKLAGPRLPREQVLARDVEHLVRSALVLAYSWLQRLASGTASRPRSSLPQHQLSWTWSLLSRVAYCWAVKLHFLSSLG